MKKIYFYCLILSVFLVLGGCSHSSYLEDSGSVGGMSAEDSPGESGGEAPEAVVDVAKSTVDLKEAAEPVKESIFVQVAGAVKNPGVYELCTGDRVFKAIEEAGGLKKNADDAALNLAAPLSDGEKVYVFRKGEAEKIAEASVGADSLLEAAGIVGQASGADSSLVNLNTADLSALKTLSGIGDVKAQAIISYRETNGPFTSVEDLKKVSGIGETTFQSIKDSITI